MNTPDNRPEAVLDRILEKKGLVPQTTPDTEWEKEFEKLMPEVSYEFCQGHLNDGIAFISNLLTSRDTYWKERVEEARKEAYAHAEIVRQRTLNDIREAVEADVPYGGAKDCVYVILDNLK